MKTVLALLWLAPALLAGDSAYHAQFVGGTLADMPPKSSAHLLLTGPETLNFECHGQALNIPYARIDTLEYGQTVSRRYAAAILISPIFLLAKSRAHYVTVGFVDPQGKQQALVFRLNKNDVRAVLTTLEARSGRRVEYQDDEARKTGK
ncbi:MAG TPA: hypothetical protein VHW24_18895 [Bryobacteraceae bacterium]|jgi:hypothetical protein|nr:hypothetical protein [Bryobacteraceae bacterium]